MAAPAFQCGARGLSLPGCTPCHTSRDIRYIFLESCRNIPAPRARDGVAVPRGHQPPARRSLGTGEDCHSSLPRRLPAFPTANTDLRGSPEAKKRLPVFRQLCGEPVEGLEELPGAPRDAVQGWRMVPACPGCSEA